jgi:transposase
MQQPNKKGYVWTFVADDLIVYRFSASRSGETPSAVLGDSTGALVVDMYTGYNQVTSTGKRTRAACLAHARRKLFDALAYAPEAKVGLDLIRDVYLVEHDAKAAGVVRTSAHLVLRQEHSRPLMDKLHAHLTEQKPHHLPKGPMGKAISYILGNWKELTQFLDDVRLPPDNSRSEAALRIVALGRKNFLHVGHEEAGANIAGLYSLVATCEATGKNPLAYLTDVQGRIGSHSSSRLDELLPQNWEPRKSPRSDPRGEKWASEMARPGPDGYLALGLVGGFLGQPGNPPGSGRGQHAAWPCPRRQGRRLDRLGAARRHDHDLGVRGLGGLCGFGLGAALPCGARP